MSVSPITVPRGYHSEPQRWGSGGTYIYVTTIASVFFALTAATLLVYSIRNRRRAQRSEERLRLNPTMNPRPRRTKKDYGPTPVLHEAFLGDNTMGWDCEVTDTLPVSVTADAAKGEGAQVVVMVLVAMPQAARTDLGMDGHGPPVQLGIARVSMEYTGGSVKNL